MATKKREGTTRRKSKAVIQKCPTGISGFDGITQGGLPKHSITLLSGGPGAGKTVFSLEFLYTGARDYGEPGVYVSFEESPEKLTTNALSSGFDLKRLVDDGGLRFFDARVSPDTITTGNFDLAGLLALVEIEAQRIKAKRIVFDGLDILLSFLPETVQRLEIWRLNRWLEESEFTAIVTIKSQDTTKTPLPSHYDWIEYIPDVVISLHQAVQGVITERKLKIRKYRGSDHVHNECAAVITDQGFHVAEMAEIKPQSKPQTKRISSGVKQLDTMMEGGYLAGSGILITGSPGTAKTSLACSFANAACARGDKVLYFAFDETGPEIIRNMASIGIDLAAHEKTGLLQFHNMHSHMLSPEENYIYFLNAIKEMGADCMVIDPLSSIDSDMATVSVMTNRLLAAAKAQKVTSLWTSLLDKTDSNQGEASRIGASTCADAWVHLSYNVCVGERNRSITIVKARGTAHSHQVRELVLSNDGISLEDVYSAEGEMFYGAAKAEKKLKDNLVEEVRKSEHKRQLRTMNAELQALNEAIKNKIEEQSILEATEMARSLKVDEYKKLQDAQSGDNKAGKTKPTKKSVGKKKKI